MLAILSKTTAALSLYIPTEVFHHFFSRFLWALTTLTFYDVVLTERLECFKNVSMFCGMKVRLISRDFI